MFPKNKENFGLSAHKCLFSLPRYLRNVNYFVQADDSEMRSESAVGAEPVHRLLSLPPGAGHHRELPLGDSHQHR